MQLSQTGQRDDRRRRVLSDLLLGSDRAVAAPRRRGPEGGPVRKSKNYGDAEFLPHAIRLIDLVPTRAVSLLALAVGCGAVLGGVVGLQFWAARQAENPAWTAFDLGARGSLAAWVASAMLALAAALAGVVYSVRRHKIDDYQGRYRVWLWAAACWLLLSVDQTARLWDVVREGLILLSGTRLYGDGSAWCVIAYGFVVGGVGTRLLVDMRHCRLSSAALLLAACGASVALVVPYGIGVRAGAMLHHGLWLGSATALLLAMALHARHVILDAQGMVAHREKPAVVVVRPPQGMQLSATPAATPSPPVSAASPAVGPSPAPAPGSPVLPDVGRKLTKDEKRALRQRLEQMRQHRAAG